MSVWQHALALSEEVFKLTIGLPRSEDYGLTSQIRRSTNSISANIAEAFGRHYRKEKINFYYFARGSTYETQNHLIYGKQVGYFDKVKAQELFNEYLTLILELNKITKSLTQSFDNNESPNKS